MKRPDSTDLPTGGIPQTISETDKYKIAISLRTKVLIYFILTCIISIGITSVAISYGVNRNNLDLLKGRLISIVSIASSSVDGDLLQKIKDPKDEDSKEYQIIREQLRKIQEKDSDITSIYTMRKTNKPEILEFVVDAQETEDTNGNGMIDPDEEKAHIGETYNASQLAPRMLDGFNAPATDDEIVVDKWGSTLSGYAPIYDSSGQVVGILGVDFDASTVKQLSRRVYKAIALASGFAVLFGIALALQFAYRIIKPMRILQEGLKSIAAGNRDVKVEVRSRDEFGMLATILNDMSTALREREVYYNVLCRYVSPAVADEILKTQKEILAIPTRRRVTIMFTDLWNFTPQTEKMKPEDVVEILNRYFGVMTKIIHEHHGTLDKFLGDGLMAIFGAPNQIPDQEHQAILAALEMKESVEKLQAEIEKESKGSGQEKKFHLQLKLGIGINTGPAVVGSIGSDQRTEYTAIGDEVNFASRIQTATRALGEEILVSLSTMSAVKHDFAFQEFENVQLKGISKSVTLYAPRRITKPSSDH